MTGFCPGGQIQKWSFQAKVFFIIIEKLEVKYNILGRKKRLQRLENIE